MVHRKRDGSQVVVTCIWVLHRDAQDQPQRESTEDCSVSRTHVVNTPMLLPLGTLSEFSKIAGDITERKQAEDARQAQSEALETQTLMLQSVLDSMTEGLVAVDEQGKFVIWNAAAEKILGMGADRRYPPGMGPSIMASSYPTPSHPSLSSKFPCVRAIHGEVSTTEMFVRNRRAHRRAPGLRLARSPLKTRTAWCAAE